MVLPDFYPASILISHLHNETNESDSNPIINNLGDKLSLSTLHVKVIFELCIRKMFCFVWLQNYSQTDTSRVHHVLFTPNTSALKALKWLIGGPRIQCKLIRVVCKAFREGPLLVCPASAIPVLQYGCYMYIILGLALFIFGRPVSALLTTPVPSASSTVQASPASEASP